MAVGNRLSEMRPNIPSWKKCRVKSWSQIVLSPKRLGLRNRKTKKKKNRSKRIRLYCYISSSSSDTSSVLRVRFLETSFFSLLMGILIPWLAKHLESGVDSMQKHTKV